MTDLQPDEIEQDPYDLLDVRLEGDVLVLRVGLSGCTPDHPFTLYVSKGFMESEPVQTWALVAHDDLGEACRAYWTRTLRFDLDPLRQWYAEVYPGGAASGLVWVRFRDFWADEHHLLFGP